MRAMLIVLIALWSVPALALIAGEELDDPVLEERAREISKELRCLVCQNQSIDDSNAGLARDLRALVRERLLAGDSDHHKAEAVFKALARAMRAALTPDERLSGQVPSTKGTIG